MTAELSSIALVVGIFLLGVLSPGPNFLVVAERSMATGFRAGVATGMGVAAGDALYAAAGLAGLAPIVANGGGLLIAVRILGGLYIAWIGGRMLWRARGRGSIVDGATDTSVDVPGCFRTGLLTDLSNPKTVVFFASIFAAAYDPSLPGWALVAMWIGIVGSSVLWRIGLAAAFSRRRVRDLYHRRRAGAEALFGSALIALGLRLAVAGDAR